MEHSKKVPNSVFGEVTQLLKEKLPESDVKDADEGLDWHFMLDKRKDKKRKRPAKKKMLTRKEKNSLGLTKLPRAGWDYRKLEKMNLMWREYASAVLYNPKKRLPNVESPDYGSFCSVLNKLEFIGAQVTIVRSNVPSYVGVAGIIVSETKFTFQIVDKNSKFKVILKENCVFEICLDKWKFTMFGKHLITRSGERSAKKIKYYSLSDLP